MKIKPLLLACSCVLPVAARAQSADDVVKKYVDARGGAAKLKSVQTERISGRISFGPGVEGAFFLEFKRPLRMHMEATIQGQTLIRAYDGKSMGWVFNPFEPSSGVQPMSAEELSTISDEADFDGPLFDYKAKGNQIELTGKDEVEGKLVNKLKLIRGNGGARLYFIDASTFLVLKWEGTTKQDDREVAIESFLRDYREVQGLKFPFEIDTSSPALPERRKFSVEKIEINPQIDDSRFAKPLPPAAPAGSAPTQPANPPSP